MVNIIASRAAGTKLVWILLVLLVPIAFLGTFLFNALEKDIRTIEREQQGAAYVRLLKPLLINAAQERVDQIAADTYIEHGNDMVASMSMMAGYGDVVRLLKAKKTNHAAVVSQVSEHIRLVSEKSGLALDSNQESFYLAYATTQGLPGLLADLGKITRVSAPGAHAQDTESQRLVAVSLVVGSWREQLDRLLLALRSATGAADVASYRGINGIAVELGTHVGDMTNLVRAQGISPAERRFAAHELSLELNGHLADDISAIWDMAQTRLEGLLAARHAALTQRMYMIVGGSLLAALLGIASAVRMFRSTLRKLDEVEDARKLADGARAEAEAMASRLESINDDIANLNIELNANMTRLKDAQEELLKKGRMEQLGHLTATVAHELRNPLGAVRTSAFLLERKVTGKGLGVENQLQRINNGIVRCDNIITQLLDFSRASVPVLTPLDLDKWLLQVIEDEAQRLPEVVSIEFRPGLVGGEASIDGARFSRAIINLVSNAAEAMVGKGDDPSKFATQTPVITIETRPTAQGPEIIVTDNGPGIKPEDLPRILEPLFTTKNFGTGLGLPAVQRIVEQHGGSMEVSSVHGQGARFTIRLPGPTNARSAA